VRFAYTRTENGKLVETRESFVMAADMVFKAIGQACETSAVGAAIQLRNGRIVTDHDQRTSHAKVWAGGDCTYGGRDLTVEAVEHGKRAAISVDQALREAKPQHPAPAKVRETQDG
jgi:glutamate synthase (NADPH/NADH) small chain